MGLLFGAGRYYSPSTMTPQERSARRRHNWQMREGRRLAELAGYRTDEHGTYGRGDHLRVGVLEYIPARDAKGAPYHDLGAEGMALICVSRKRVYARSSSWGPSTAEAYFVVGRNEAGTYYAHPVTAASTLAEALAWMWQGYEVIARQGDIALVRGGRSGYVPELPTGHTLTADGITHPTHPLLPLPGKGERVIVARRARPWSHGTRD